jgi:imidazolonepropionase-like amidohydrolase
MILLAMSIAVLALSTARDEGEAGAPFLLLTGGRLIDGTGANPVEDAAVVIGDERILYAGPKSAIRLPRFARNIDVSGMTILPGFINAHVHAGLSVRNLEAWARAGVTTVRDLGCNPSSLASFRNANPPEPERARLVAAGPLISVPDGYPMVPHGGGGWATTVTSIDGARRIAEDLLDGGCDLLKLALETGTIFNRDIPVLSREQARAIVDVAHGRGTVVSAHITSCVDLDLALDVGADDLAHMAVDRMLTFAEVDRVVREDVYWVPTLELWQCTGPVEMAISNLSRFVEGGGRVALGTDYEGYTCNWDLGMPMNEVRLMANAGMTPMEIIESATRHGADVCNLENQIGTLEKGKIADLFVVDGDPLTDLESLGQVRLVVHDGTIIRNEIAGIGSVQPRRPSDRVEGEGRDPHSL